MTTTPATAAPPTAATGRPDRWWDDPWTIATVLVATALTALALWPLWDLVHTALDLHWNPSGDWAAIVLRTDDVGRLTPLVGPYSRFGWNHPGPWLFWLLSVPYHVFGGRPESVLAAAAFLNGVTVIAISLVAWRRGRLLLVALTMGSVAILFHALGPVLLRDPWNPYLTLLPLALIVLLSWSIADGDPWMWIPLAFVASVEVQSHVGYLPMIVTTIAMATLLAWRRRSECPLFPTSTTARRVLFVGVGAVLLACWLPVVIDQVWGTGNAWNVADYFLSSGGRSAGLGTAIEEMAGQLRVLGAPWLGAKELADANGQLLGASAWALVAPFAVMAASLWFAVRRRAGSAVRFQIVVLAATIGGFIATARVIGPIYDWIIRWWWVLACLWWLSILWSVWSAALTFVRSIDLRRALTTAVAAIATLVTLSAVTPVVRASHRAVAPNASTSEILKNFLQPVVDAVHDKGPVLVETTGSVRGDYGDAIRYALERAGVDVAVAPDLVTHFGPERSTDRRTPTAVLWVVSADAIAGFRADPSMVELGGWDPLTPTERAAYRVDERELQRQLRAAGRDDLAVALTNGGGGVDTQGLGLEGVDQTLLARVEAMRRKGDPVAVFLGPAPTD